MRVLQLGDSGEDVRTLQAALNKHGASLVLDGLFGSQLRNAVILFQGSEGLVTDGVVGPKTWAALGISDQPTSQILGIDLYSENAVTDFNQIAKVKNYCFLKASEGLTYNDTKFAARRIAARAAGLIVGHYHYFHPAYDATAQANHFCRVVGNLQPGELPPAIDFETHEGTSAKLEVMDALVCLHRVESLLGVRPMIYGSPSYIDELGNPVSFAGYHLWLANYAPQPHVPRPFSTYSFWQNSSSGSVPGIHGDVDLDVFNGSVDDLKALCVR